MSLVKMRLLVLVITLSWSTDLVSSDGGADTGLGVGSTKAWFWNPNHAAYQRGDVSAQSYNGKNTELTDDRTQLQANANVQGKGDFHAGKTSQDTAVAKNPSGKQATIDRSQKGQGMRKATGGKYEGDLHSQKSGNDNHQDLSLNTGQKLDTVMHGTNAKDSSFDAQGSKGHKYNVDPSAQDKGSGAGTITMDGTKHNYKEDLSTSGQGEATLDNVQTRRWGNQVYKCQGQKQGLSNCVDKDGHKVGEVQSQPDGTVIVSKVMSPGVVAPIYRSQVIKNQNGQSVATVNNGLFQAQAGNYKERDCIGDYPNGKPGSKVQLQRPLSVIWNSEDRSGKRVYQFPDCVTIGGKLTLPPGVDANRIAIQFDISILPAGKLKCVDMGSCNKDCYYCNFCNNSRKVDILYNTNGNNLCNRKGGGTYDVKVTACPPPSAFTKAQCSGFTKQDPSYFKKKGDLQTRVLVWVRPPNELQLRNDFYNKVKSNSIAFNLFKTQYSIDAATKGQIVNQSPPTDFDYEEYYINKNGNPPTELVQCTEGTTNYTMSKNHQATSFLLEAGSIGAAPKSLFDSRPCPAVDQINQQQAAADAAVAAQNKPASSGWQSWFTGGGGGSGGSGGAPIPGTGGFANNFGFNGRR